MNKPKVLVFIDWYLPGYRAGGPIQSCANLIEHFKNDVDFSIVTRDTDYCDDKKYANIISNQWNTLDNGTRVYYFSADKLNVLNLKKIVAAEQFEVAYINGIFSFYFSILPLFLVQNKKRILAVRGMLAPSAIGEKSIKKRIFLFFAKLFSLYKNTTLVASNQLEKEFIIAALGSKNDVFVAPNLTTKNIINHSFNRIKSEGKLKLISIARISPEKNLLFALECLSAIEANIVFDIYGPINDENYWKECKIRIGKLPKNIVVNYRGSLPTEKINEVFSTQHFLFLPTKGENFGHIILQSLASGCPVIISDKTPWRNLEIEKIGFDIDLNEPKLFLEKLNYCAEMKQETYDTYSKYSIEYYRKINNNEEAILANKKLFLGVNFT